MIRFIRNGEENGKSAYLVRRKAVGQQITVGSIVFDGQDWVMRSAQGRVGRFAKLADAKEEALKI